MIMPSWKHLQGAWFPEGTQLSYHEKIMCLFNPPAERDSSTDLCGRALVKNAEKPWISTKSCGHLVSQAGHLPTEAAPIPSWF